MLFSLLNSGNDMRVIITQIAFTLIIVLISLSVHEYAHGYAAYKLGDNTAYNFGRLTLNPLKHIDFLGMLCMLLFGFGWAKPVPINSRNFKKTRRDIAIVSVAGPVSNLVLAIIGIILLNVVKVLFVRNYISLNEYEMMLYSNASIFFYLFSYMNISLAVFNFLPIPPLDGSRLITVILPKKMALLSFKYERYVQIALFVLLYLGAFTNIISTCVDAIFNGISYLVTLIPIFRI